MAAGEDTIYRSCSQVVEAQYRDHENETPAEKIIESISKAADSDPLELPPLYEFVDPDSLNKLFENTNGSTELFLSFQIENWNVFIRSDGSIRVCDDSQRIEPTPVFGESDE